MFFNNLRFNPVCDYLFLNDSKVLVDRVANLTYLGTILNSKMNFKLNMEHIVKKAQKNCFYEVVVFS